MTAWFWCWINPLHRHFTYADYSPPFKINTLKGSHMTKTRRIIHHACWFALLGPHAGVPVAIIAQALTDSWTAKELLAQILLLLPFFILYTWLAGGLAALLTGIAAACLPERIYRSKWRRALVSGVLGSVIATLCWLLMAREFTLHSIWISTGPGLLAGIIMGWIAPRLPFRGKTEPTRVVNTLEPDR